MFHVEQFGLMLDGVYFTNFTSQVCQELATSWVRLATNRTNLGLLKISKSFQEILVPMIFKKIKICPF